MGLTASQPNNFNFPILVGDLAGIDLFGKLAEICVFVCYQEGLWVEVMAPKSAKANAGKQKTKEEQRDDTLQAVVSSLSQSFC